MRYANRSDDGKVLKLDCQSIGSFDVKSGQGRFENNPHCTSHENAAIPAGEYWVVDRPRGGLRTQMQAKMADWYRGSNHEEWFALYSIKTNDNHLYINGVCREGFRLHPVNQNGEGESQGCITLLNNAEFNYLRKVLKASDRYLVTGTNIQAYGKIKVIGEGNDALCPLR
jgi:hypothetical protein